jgi:hypothetical protein
MTRVSNIHERRNGLILHWMCVFNRESLEYLSRCVLSGSVCVYGLVPKGKYLAPSGKLPAQETHVPE